MIYSMQTLIMSLEEHNELIWAEKNPLNWDQRLQNLVKKKLNEDQHHYFVAGCGRHLNTPCVGQLNVVLC